MKKLQKKLYFLCFVCLANLTVSAQDTKLHYTIAPWLNNKKAAASITLDDAIIGQFTIALPLLNKYNLNATFFITTRIMQGQGITWKMINDAAKTGNEIANHTIDHPYLRRMSADSIIYEVDACNKLVDQNVPSQKSITMAYPFGDGGNATDSEAFVRKVVPPYCIGARATRNNRLAYNSYDFAKTNEDYYRVNSDMITDSATMAGLPARLDETISGGGWYVPTYHGIENGWIITPAAIFEKHLQEFAKRKNDLWITTFAEALKYHKERNCASLKTISENNRSLTLSLTDTLNNDLLWDEPLTISVTKPGLKVKSIMQNKTQIPFTVEGETIIFNAAPGKNKIVISKG